jgi:phosphoribosylformylglycinamidine cyclo-ligase
MLTYKKAGVDIDKADRLVKFLKKKAPAIGGFSGLFPLSLDGIKHPHLVASTDGVGTKLKVAQMLKKHDTIGIDLVAMCVNDLIACGARPLFFLDYYATGKLDLGASKQILAGILEGCRQGNMMLLGGETAEMPGAYPKGEYDLAGFSVGIVDKKEVIDGSKIYPGDLILGLPSSGLHSNGYSLARRILSGRHLKKWGRQLLEPTRIYVDDVRRLQTAFAKKGHIILGMAHITGGGLPDNVKRVLPKHVKASFDTQSWERPEIFHELQSKGRVPEKDMWRTFNMGIGLVIIIRPHSLALAQEILPEARVIGKISTGRARVILNGKGH